MTNQEKQNRLDSPEAPAAKSATDTSEGANESTELTVQELEPRIAPVVRKSGSDGLPY